MEKQKRLFCADCWEKIIQELYVKDGKIKFDDEDDKGYYEESIQLIKDLRNDGLPTSSHQYCYTRHFMLLDEWGYLLNYDRLNEDEDYNEKLVMEE